MTVPNRGRRAVLGALLGGGLLGLSVPVVRQYVDLFAPASGTAWESAVSRHPERVESPHGPASVESDDRGVPVIRADDPAAAWFAVGYVQAADRLFQMDLQRRLMRGRLSEVVGEPAVDSDEFHLRMDFLRAAEASWDVLEDPETIEAVEAYGDGVNAAMGEVPRTIEFHLVDFAPDPWSPVDTMLVQKLISWSLTGSFRDVRAALVADRLGSAVADELYPDRFDHDVPILREWDGGSDADPNDGGSGTDPDEGETDTGSDDGEDDHGEEDDETASSGTARPGSAGSIGSELAGWLSGVEAPTGVGSNSWVIGPEHTADGRPIVANDPHLALSAPPTWYEQVIDTEGVRVRGVAFPGVPFVVIGHNEHGAWGFTNAGTDVLDTYTYEVDGDRYRYGDEWRSFETETVELPVRDGADRTIEVKRTVHGPYLERAEQHVGVSWTGLAGTRTAEAVHALDRSTGLEDVREAIQYFEEPTQCLVYGDVDGHTLFSVVGRIPIRHTNGEPVRADRVFDGSAREGAWPGFEPYGETDWTDGFIPLEELPRVIDPDLLATANQRIVDADDYPHYLGSTFAAPYRAARIEDRLSALVEGDDPVDANAALEPQRDPYDGRTEQFVPLLETASETWDPDEHLHDELLEAIEELREWDGIMGMESRAALVFGRFLEHLRAAVFGPPFEDADLDPDTYAPGDWVLGELDPDGPFLQDRSLPALYREALAETVTEIETEDWTVWGQYNTTRAIEHALGLGELGYEEFPVPGSRASPMNYRVESGVGASWRMVVEPGDVALGILPGGNSGNVFSPHYEDQLQEWVLGQYRRLPLAPDRTSRRIRFEGGGDA